MLRFRLLSHPLAMAADRRIQAAAFIAGLPVENRSLSTDVEEAASELQLLERQIASKDEELETLAAQCYDQEVVLRDLRRMTNMWSSEKEAMEKAYNNLDHESTSIILALVTTQADLQERLERKTRALLVLSAKVMKMLKGIEEKVRPDDAVEAGVEDGWEMMEDDIFDLNMEEDGHDEEEDYVDVDQDDEGMAAMLKPFADQVRKIENALKIRRK